jgi:small subunit ribosomal protein S2
MPKTPEIMEMLKAGLHFGHRTSKWHPKMEKYIFTSRNGIHIIDLMKTAKELEKSLDFVKTTTSKGGTVLFLGSKPQVKEMVKKSAIEAGTPYIVERWLGGTITNFSIISKGIQKYTKLKTQKEKGEWEKFAKKERLKMDKDLARMERKYGGLEKMDKIPDAVLVIDAKTEETALAESRVKGVKTIGLCDTNVNPDKVDYIIPGNDNSVKGVELILKLMVAAVKEGKEGKQQNIMEQDKKDDKK